MKKIIGWLIGIVAFMEFFKWAFGQHANIAHKVIFVVAVILLILILIGVSDRDSKKSQSKKSQSKNSNTQATPTYYVGGNTYATIDMNTNIIKTHKSSHPAVSNAFFTSTAKYWKEKPIGHVGINGKPGVGLNSSDFDNKRIQAGQKGEKELAQMMCYLGIASEAVQTYWSLRLPNCEYDTDVDAIVSYNNNIILLDAKQYIAGENLRYERHSVGVVDVKDVATGELVKQYAFSHNMDMAFEKYSEFFPDAHIEGAVLLCPTRNGIAATDANLGICDGKLAVTQSWAYLNDLKADIDKSHGRTNPEYDRKLKELLKS